MLRKCNDPFYIIETVLMCQLSFIVTLENCELHISSWLLNALVFVHWRLCFPPVNYIVIQYFVVFRSIL